MLFPITIEWGDDTHVTGIVFPDIPGATTAGDTVEQAYELAVEVAHIQLEELVSAGKPIPMPGSIEQHRNYPEFEGWGRGLVEIDVTPYLGKTEKVNAILPSTLVRRVDDYVTLHGVKSRSAFLTTAALHELDSRTR